MTTRPENEWVVETHVTIGGKIDVDATNGLIRLTAGPHCNTWLSINPKLNFLDKLRGIKTSKEKVRRAIDSVQRLCDEENTKVEHAKKVLKEIQE